MYTRGHHFKAIFVGWWGVVTLLWSGLCSADVLVGHYGSETVKNLWDAVWIAPLRGWRVWLVGVGLIVVIAIFEKSFRVIHSEIGKKEDLQSQYEERATTLREQIKRLNDAKPDVRAVVDCGGQAAMLDITNHGAIADVWASLRVKGAVNGNRVDMFARWANQDGEKTRIAKGETRKLALASLKLDYASRTSQWQIFCAGDASQGRHVVPATYTHAIGIGHVVPDVHLYVKLFSDPDCIEVAREHHIVLHSSRAEELSD